MHRSTVQRLRQEEGAFVVEILVAAVLVLVIGTGVLLGLEGAEATSAHTREKAVAANLVEQEIDRLRALPLATLQTYLPGGGAAAEQTRTVGGDTFTVTSRADYVSATDGSSTCGAAGTTADVLRLGVTVRSAREGARPVALQTLLAPSASAAAGQGAAKVEITDRTAAGVAGIAVTLTGPQTQSASTDAAGCVDFAYLPAGVYRVTFARPGWVDPKGRETVTEELLVAARETSSAAFRYDRAQAVALRFWSRREPGVVDGVARLPDAAPVTTSFAAAFLGHPENDASRPLALTAPAGSPPAQRVAGLFPFLSPYAVWPTSCTAPAPPLGTGSFLATDPGPHEIRVPALDVQVRPPGGVLDAADAQVVVTTDCGDRIGPRPVRADGHVADPGFPHGTALRVCGQVRLRSTGQTVHRVLTDQRNERLEGTPVVVDLASAPPEQGACP